MSDLISRQDAIKAVGLNTWAGSRISQLPTVEAIPIEFIKRFATFYPPTPIYIGDEESIDMDSWCKDLLEYWEKENETEID